MQFTVMKGYPHTTAAAAGTVTCYTCCMHLALGPVVRHLSVVGLSTPQQQPTSVVEVAKLISH
jgi:hypothetical protein